MPGRLVLERQLAGGVLFRRLGSRLVSGSLLGGRLLLRHLRRLLLCLSERLEEDGNEEVHDDHEPDEQSDPKVDARGDDPPGEARLIRVDPSAGEDDQDNEHRRNVRVEVIARALVGAARPREDLRAEEGEDGHEDEEEDEHVCNLWPRSDEGRKDLVHALPVLHEAEESEDAEEAEGAEGVEVDGAHVGKHGRVGLQPNEAEVEHGRADEEGVKTVPPVGEELGRSEGQEAQEDLAHE